MIQEEQSAYFKLLGVLLYNEPSLTSVNKLINDAPFTELPYAAENEAVLKGLELMVNWLKSSNAEGLTDVARSDYMRLFVGPGKLLAPPWGSVYLDKDRLIFDENTLVVRQFYERFGMKLKEKYKEPDDHIGLELEFLAYLAEQGEEEAMVSFAKNFMLPWILRWNSDIQKNARTDYYKGLANMAIGGVQELCGL